MNRHIRLSALTYLFAVTIALLSGCQELPDASPLPYEPSQVRPDWVESFEQRIVPSRGEMAWDSIPWLSTYAEGVAAAQEQNRPLLMWAMNGHPLGCT